MNWRSLNGKYYEGSIEEILEGAIQCEYNLGNQLKICVGTDSQVYKDKIEYATVVVVLHQGRGGFMFIKSDKKMKKFFNPESISVKQLNKYKTNDQTHINRNKSKFNYNVLPLNEFPNGPKFYDNFGDIDPRIIHFNYVRGHEKIKLMKKYDEWYL